MNNDNSIAVELLHQGNRIERVLEELFPRRLAASEDDHLTEAFWHHMGSGGKRIRPALCLLTCDELGGRSDDALHFAAAVEILHNMFLVHDDLQDGDRMRRDRPAVWVRYGCANAINLGDYMLGRAIRAVLDSPVDDARTTRLLRLFNRTYENTCRGQALDLNWRGRNDMNVDMYMRMVQLKTADYLVLGMIGGAVIAQAPDTVLNALRDLGRCMGPAFQIRDDIIDLTRGKGRGGELGNDIKEGKPSILFAHAVNVLSEADRDYLMDVIQRDRADTTPDDVQSVIRLYEQCGAMAFASDRAAELTRGAYEAVDRIPLKNKDVFRRIVHYMVERTQ